MGDGTTTSRAGRPNPSVAVDVAGFVDQLRLLKEWSGNPSLDRLRELTSIPRSTLADALNPSRAGLPALETVHRMLQALGLSDAEAADWTAAYRRIQAALDSIRDSAHGATQPARGGAPRASVPNLGPSPTFRKLPAGTALFVGRDADLRALDRLLSGGSRVGIVCGPAGSGKTALAVHWAHRVADRFPDGQLYLNLGGFGPVEPMSVQQALAVLLRGLGVPGEEIPGEIDGQVALYSSLLSQRRVLILLDDAAGPHQVRSLLPDGSGCLTVVTSRDQMSALADRDSVRRLRLGALPPEQAKDLLAQILGADRVAAEPAAALDLARLCAHLPLALRIAATNLAGYLERALAAYVERLGGVSQGRRPDGEAESRPAGAEERAVRATFDASYTDLDPLSQRLFRRLAHVTGPDFSATVAATLINSTVSEAERLLAIGVRAHLIEPIGGGRYLVQDLLRFYATERLRAEEGDADRDDVRRRLFSWYLHSAAAAVQTLQPPTLWLPLPPAGPDVRPLVFEDTDSSAETATESSTETATDAATAWLDAEHANLLSVVSEAARGGPHAVAWHVVDVLSTYLGMRAHRVESLNAAQIGLEAAMQADDPDAEAAMYMRLGQAQDALGDARSAVRHAVQAVALSRTLGDQLREAVTLISLGDGMRKLARPDQAGKAYANAAALFRDLDQAKFLARVTCRIGLVQQDRGRLGEAAEALRAALRQHTRSGDQLGEAETLGYLAGVLHDAGRDRDALQQANRALKLAAPLGPAAEADAGIQRALCRLVPVQEAVEQLGHALELAQSVGYRSAEARALLALAEVHGRHGDGERVRSYAERALHVARATGYYVIELRAEGLLGEEE